MARRYSFDHVQVLAKKNGEWVHGTVKRGTLNPEATYPTLDDAKKVPMVLISVKEFLKQRDADVEFSKDLFGFLGTEEVFVLNPPLEATEKEWEKYWNEKTNPTCAACSKKCKEGMFVSVMQCPTTLKK